MANNSNKQKEQDIGIFGVLALVGGVISLFYGYNAENPTIIWIGIFLCLLAVIFFGIVGFTYHQQVMNKNDSEHNSNKDVDNADKLLRLKELYDEGILNEKEYNQKREEFLNDL